MTDNEPIKSITILPGREGFFAQVIVITAKKTHVFDLDTAQTFTLNQEYKIILPEGGPVQ